MGESAGSMRGWGVIRLYRGQGFYRDRLRAYRVRIDGNLAGEVSEGETKDFFVPPDEHRVRTGLSPAGDFASLMLARAGDMSCMSMQK
jgi:hypothetical protein